MSLIGTLEQLSLPTVFQRIEQHKKSGLLVVKQGDIWVEFYFQDGRLLCIGPLRTQATLGERLVNDQLISPQTWHNIKRMLGDAEQKETRVAFALMDLGYVDRDRLRSWATQKAVDVLRAIKAWSVGNVYFEEGTAPPEDRLLVSMSISTIIEQASQVPQSRVSKPITPLQSAPGSGVVYRKVTFNNPARPAVNRPAAVQVAAPSLASSVPSTPRPDVANVPTLMSPTQFFSNALSVISPFMGIVSTDALPSTEELLPVSFAAEAADIANSLFQDDAQDISFASLLSPTAENSSSSASKIHAVRVTGPLQPKRIDTSFMQPDMLLMPADLSAFRKQNPFVQVTPDQWVVLACADGQTTLRAACQKLALPPEVFCQLAGELIASHLLHVSFSKSPNTDELRLVPREPATVGASNGYRMPNYGMPSYGGVMSAQSQIASAATADVQLQFPNSLPFETESQWGNGGNGATFVPGRGWITAPQPLRPLQSPGPLANATFYR